MTTTSSIGVTDPLVLAQGYAEISKNVGMVNTILIVMLALVTVIIGAMLYSSYRASANYTNLVKTLIEQNKLERRTDNKAGMRSPLRGS